MDHDSGEPVVGVLAEAKSAEKMNNASIQRLSWGPNSSENNGQELKNKSHFMALSHGFCGGGGDCDRKSLFGASCFETKPYCGCCSN